MNVLPPRFSMLPKPATALSSGPVTWGLITGLAVGSGILLACLSPVIGIATLAVLSVAIISKAVNDCRQDSTANEPPESWEESTARIGAYAESLEQEQQMEQRRYQGSLLGTEKIAR
jgi:hypothetical protein